MPEEIGTNFVRTKVCKLVGRKVKNPCGSVYTFYNPCAINLIVVRNDRGKSERA